MTCCDQNIVRLNLLFLVWQIWKQNLYSDSWQQYVTFNTVTYESYWDARGRGTTTDATGSNDFYIASRLVPQAWVEENPDDALQLLEDLSGQGFYTFNYFMGGAQHDVAGNASAMHPVARQAIWMIECYGSNVEESDRMIATLREALPDSAASYNHASKKEPDWKNAFWGENYERLVSIKESVDPEYRFNCWHCVEYQGEDRENIDVPADINSGSMLSQHLMVTVIGVASLSITLCC